MDTDLREAVYDFLTTEVEELRPYDEDSKDLGNVFYREIPEGISEPIVCVFQELTNRPELRDNIDVRIESVYLEFTYYAPNRSDLEEMIKKHRDAFDDCESTLSVSGYEIISVRWQATRDSLFNQTDRVIIEYKIRLQKEGE